MGLLPSLPTTSCSFSFHYTLYVVVDPTDAADVVGDSSVSDSLGHTISIATTHTHNFRVCSLCDSATLLLLLAFTPPLLRIVNRYHEELKFATISDLTASATPSFHHYHLFIHPTAVPLPYRDETNRRSSCIQSCIARPLPSVAEARDL